MDLKIYKIESTLDMESVEKKLKELDYYTNIKEDVGIFSFSKINDNTYHIIFYIKEEYCTNTKYVENLNKIPMDVYINTFLIADKKYLLIEKLYNEYFNLIVEKYKLLLNLDINSYEITEDFFEDLVNRKARKILHCDINIDGYIKSVENKENIIDEISKGNTIEFIVFTVEREGLTKITTSLSKGGVINSKATSPIILINIINTVLEGK
ncbi:hypothetical protein EUAN_08330 [Andreesenia angusta]|uniref:Uncharacterized protein n=1 Tax=Andreesenia angusta TaxID=39480 RepID=A0A1S1VB39_9FIRM|nr:hypothetical protein [Andreesenia angusta]OHW63049.1 hypothetical protein EUAN_08330 [Andreesenia angusta]